MCCAHLHYEVVLSAALSVAAQPKSGRESMRSPSKGRDRSAYRTTLAVLHLQWLTVPQPHKGGGNLDCFGFAA